MLQTIAFATVASLGLVLGSLVGVFWKAPRPFHAAVLAFAAGSRIAALAFELFDREKHQNLLVASVGLVAGAAIFIVADAMLAKHLPKRKAAGFALLLAVTLDGVPENLALGVTLATSGSVALLTAIFVANVAEALGGAAEMRAEGESPRRTIVLWFVTAGLLTTAVFLGRFLGGESSESFFLAFAGGAVLAAIADTLVPEAYREGGPYVAFATVAGFLLSFVLASSN